MIEKYFNLRIQIKDAPSVKGGCAGPGTAFVKIIL